jgi:O-antigen ligase
MLDSSVRGASIVQLPDGESFLRAYGTLPHPNILGGFTLVLLLGPITFFIRKERPNNLALLLLMPGISLLALTFSRSAWLAVIVFSLVLLWKSKYFDGRRLALLLIIIAISFIVTLLPYRQLVQARTTGATSHSEEFSFIGRAWLSQEALRMIGEHPFTGVGIGSFITELAKRAGEGYVIEPVHNIFLLAGAELGILGLLLAIALSIFFLYRLFKAQNPNAILAGATLTGLGVIGFFDHYLWTLASGRLMLGLVIGLFVGQGISHDG